MRNPCVIRTGTTTENSSSRGAKRQDCFFDTLSVGLGDHRSHVRPNGYLADFVSKAVPEVVEYRCFDDDAGGTGAPLSCTGETMFHHRRSRRIEICIRKDNDCVRASHFGLETNIASTNFLRGGVTCPVGSRERYRCKAWRFDHGRYNVTAIGQYEIRNAMWNLDTIDNFKQVLCSHRRQLRCLHYDRVSGQQGRDHLAHGRGEWKIRRRYQQGRTECLMDDTMPHDFFCQPAAKKVELYASFDGGRLDLLFCLSQSLARLTMD